MITHLHLSRRGLMAGAAGLALTVPGAPPARAAGTLSVVDTVSGPNFQAFWSTYLIPKIRKDDRGRDQIHGRLGPDAAASDADLARRASRASRCCSSRTSTSPTWSPPASKFDPLYPGAREGNSQPGADRARNTTRSTTACALHGAGLLFWRAQFGLIHNTAFVKSPPKTWAEFFDRRAEFKGHIGMVRTDASSGGGRAVMYAFLAANGVDFKQAVRGNPGIRRAWKNGLSTFTEFSRAFAQPIASEPPVMFHQFQTEQVWMTSYAQDYSLWSAEQGQLAADHAIHAARRKHHRLVQRLSCGAGGRYARQQKADAYKVINLLLSDDVQLHMLETMYEYPGTNAWKKAPAAVWKKIAPVDVAQARGINDDQPRRDHLHPEARDGLHRVMTVRAGAPGGAAALDGRAVGRRPVLSAQARHLVAGWLLVAPLGLFLAAAFYYPLAYTLGQSVTPSHGTGWTLAHYAGFLGSREGLGVLALTLGLSFAATAALGAAQPAAGAAAAPPLLRPPRAAVPDDAADHHPGAGRRTRAADSLRPHRLDQRRAAAACICWREPLVIDYTIPGLILFYVWMFFPYGGLVIMSGLGAIDPALEEAGRVMGARPAVVFRAGGAAAAARQPVGRRA